MCFFCEAVDEFMSGNTDKAIRLLQHVIVKEDAYNFEARMLLASSYAISGNHKAAANVCFAAAVCFAKSTPERLVAEARQQQFEGCCDMKKLKEAAKWEESAAAQYYYGKYLSESGQQDKAIVYLERAVELGYGTVSYASFDLAEIYWKKGNMDEAKNWYDRAIDDIPSMTIAHIGVTKYWLNDQSIDSEEHAKRAFEKARLLNPTLPDFDTYKTLNDKEIIWSANANDVADLYAVEEATISAAKILSAQRNPSVNGRGDGDDDANTAALESQMGQPSNAMKTAEDIEVLDDLLNNVKNRIATFQAELQSLNALKVKEDEKISNSYQLRAGNTKKELCSRFVSPLNDVDRDKTPSEKEIIQNANDVAANLHAFEEAVIFVLKCILNSQRSSGGNRAADGGDDKMKKTVEDILYDIESSDEVSIDRLNKIKNHITTLQTDLQSLKIKEDEIKLFERFTFRCETIFTKCRAFRKEKRLKRIIRFFREPKKMYIHPDKAPESNVLEFLGLLKTKPQKEDYLRLEITKFVPIDAFLCAMDDFVSFEPNEVEDDDLDRHEFGNVKGKYADWAVSIRLYSTGKVPTLQFTHKMSGRKLNIRYVYILNRENYSKQMSETNI